MRKSLLAILCSLTFGCAAAHAQQDPTRHMGVEGNWTISWSDVQDEDTPSDLRVSIYRDRMDTCKDKRMSGCQFKMVPVPGAGWKLKYMLSGGSYFVQSVSANPAGNQLEIEHAYGLHGHWGGIESVTASGPNTMTGHWRYKDTEGRSIWRRVVPLISRVTAHNAPNLRHMRASTALSGTHLKLVFNPTSPAWSLDQPFPDQRPTIVIRAEGHNLWGFQSASMQGATGIHVSSPRLMHNPTGAEFLEFDLTFWPGVRAGRHILNISGTPVTLDLELDSAEIVARATMHTGNSTAHRPMGSSPVSNPTLSQHRVTANVRKIGDRPFTQVEATFRAEVPLVLLGAPKCQNAGPQIVVCNVENANGQFDIGFGYAAQPVAGHEIVRPKVSMRARARDPQTGAWVNAGRAKHTVFVRNCDAAFRNTLKQVAAANDLRTAARKALKPVASLPGKRLYPGPVDDPDAKAALSRQVTLLTDALASNKGLDGWLFAQARAQPNVFDRFAEAARLAKTRKQCSQANTLSQEAAAARVLLAELRANRRSTQSAYLGVRAMMEFNEKIVAAKLKGFSGSLPKPLQTVLGVGGNTDAPSTDRGLINRFAHEFSQGVVGWVPGEFAVLSTAILEQTAALLPGATSSGVLSKAPSVVSIMMITAQIEISIVDLVILLQLNDRYDNITAWMEAGAYIQGLLARYDALDTAFATALYHLETAPHACTCQ